MTQEKAEIKHTPGPWTSEDISFKHDAFYGIPIIEAATGYGMATAWQVDNVKASDTQRANARLIAAAPDLLAALVAAYAEIDGLHWTNDRVEGVLAAARAAIAKATNPKP